MPSWIQEWKNSLPLVISALTGLAGIAAAHPELGLVGSLAVVVIDELIYIFTNEETPVKPTSTPTNPFSLSVDNLKPAIGSTITIKVSGGIAGAAYVLMQPEVSGAVTGSRILDTNGNDTIVYVVTQASVIGGVLNAAGSITLYALDNFGTGSNDVTLTKS